MSDHKRTCRAYGNYQPPYEDCTCGAEGAPVAPRTPEREASVPQGGEFTVEQVLEEIYALGGDGRHTQIRMLRAYARSLSSAPGERT
jgi:hypothetical protein